MTCFLHETILQQPLESDHGYPLELLLTLFLIFNFFFQECHCLIKHVLLVTFVDVMQLLLPLIKEKMPTSVQLDTTVPKELVNLTTVL